MEGTTKILKRKGSDCKNDISKKKRKTLLPKKVLKSGIQLKRERKKLTKNKNQKVVTSGCSNEIEGEPGSKKRIANSKKKSPKNDKHDTEEKDRKIVPQWTDEEYLAEVEDITISTAKTLIELFKQENTIPFIARYRGHLTDHLTPDKLRKIKGSYDYIDLVKKKAYQLIQQVPSNELTPEFLFIIQSVRTLEELEFIGARFKRDSRSLAQRAKEAGLQPAAEQLLEGNHVVHLSNLVRPGVTGLEDSGKIKMGIQHIIADIISKEDKVRDLLGNFCSSREVLLTSKFKSGMSDADKEASKYALYGDFSQPLPSILPHQTLAINRGELAKELTVKIIIPDSLWQPLKTFCNKRWMTSGYKYDLRTIIFNDSVEDAIKRLISPFVVRTIRAKLNAKAESEALHTFSVNLRQLLMTPPCSGHVVMGIDPGFKNGCKVAVVSRTGEPLDYGRFFLSSPTEAERILTKLVSKHGCDLIALGNGKACRETETLLSKLIGRRVFKPNNVSYTIINEQGVSIYSCSPAAEEEFPNVDPNIVGAVSIARRLQNALSELVKVEAKHLGVGMYQHDLEEKRLESTLNDIVSECVSFVGVDINSASFHLLKRVAGLNAAKAKEIIKYRTEHCTFKRREDLLKVKGIKEKTFQQCAGFIRVIPATAFCFKHWDCSVEFNPLDETCIHPESYDIALKIIGLFQLNLKDVGTENFVEALNARVGGQTITGLAKKYNCSTLELDLILDSLKKTKDFDERSLAPGPIFRNGATNLEDLVPGEILEGVVRNVVSFGAFVDVGVGLNGLIHVSQLRNTPLRLNDRVRAEVISINLCPEKIDLRLLSVL